MKVRLMDEIQSHCYLTLKKCKMLWYNVSDSCEILLHKLNLFNPLYESICD